MHKLVLILAGLAQFASCAGGIVSLPLEKAHAARSIETPENVQLVAGGEELTVISGPDNAWLPRTFTREGKTLLSLPEEWSWCSHAGEYAVSREDGSWWYSRCAGDSERLLVRLVISEAPSQAAAIEIARPPKSGRGWLPIRSNEVEGVLLTTVRDSEWTLQAELVSRGGAKELAVIERTDSAMIGPQTWQAHRLGDGRIAVVSLDIDRRAGTTGVLLRVFAGGEVTVSRLRFEFDRPGHAAVASALGSDGSLAVIAGNRNAIEAIVVDPNDPTAARSRLISTTGTTGDLHLTASGNRFVAAWRQTADRTIRLAEFDRQFAFPAVVVGAEAGRLLDLRGGAEGIDVYWSAPGGVAHRRLPHQPTGYVIASDAWVWLRSVLR